MKCFVFTAAAFLFVTMWVLEQPSPIGSGMHDKIELLHLQSVSVFTIGRKKTPSQLLTDQAHRVDFRGGKDGEEEDMPAPKRRTSEKWPWEAVHAKLKLVHRVTMNQTVFFY